MLRLNLASGTDIKPPPWVNLDVVKQWPGAPPCDIIWDARKHDLPFGSDTVDEVYAGYLFLHIPRAFHIHNLMEIRRVLKPGGVLQVGEVDMDLVLRRWLDDPFDHRLNQLIWGEQGLIHGEGFAEFDLHVQGFNEATLRAFLESSAFRLVERVKIHVDAVWYELTLKCRK
jgi:predicted SAM-dependent methyltransferase